MKKIKFILITAAILFGFSSMAQFTYGPKAGLNLANQSGDDVENNSMLIAFNAGLAANYSVNEMFGLQAEVLYDMKGANYETMNANNETEDVPYSVSYINVPILGQVQFGDDIKFYGELGPTFGFLMSAAIDGETEASFTNPVTGATTTVEFKENYTSTDIGAAIGAGAVIPLSSFDLVVGARYNMGLTSIGEEQETTTFDPITFQPTTTTYTPDIKNSVISVNVGIMFGGN